MCKKGAVSHSSVAIIPRSPLKTTLSSILERKQSREIGRKSLRDPGNGVLLRAITMDCFHLEWKVEVESYLFKRLQIIGTIAEKEKLMNLWGRFSTPVARDFDRLIALRVTSSITLKKSMGSPIYSFSRLSTKQERKKAPRHWRKPKQSVHLDLPQRNQPGRVMIWRRYQDENVHHENPSVRTQKQIKHSLT